MQKNGVYIQLIQKWGKEYRNDGIKLYGQQAIFDC